MSTETRGSSCWLGSQIVNLLSVHRVDEVPDLNCSALTIDEMERILMLRKDLGELSIQRIVEYLQQQKKLADQEQGVATS